MRLISCSVLICSNGIPRLRIFELYVGRNSPWSQYMAPSYSPGTPGVVVEVGMGVSGAIQAFHLIDASCICFVTLGAAGSTEASQAGGGGPSYSSARRPKLWPASC